MPDVPTLGHQTVFGCYCGQRYTNGQKTNETKTGSNNIGPPFGPKPDGAVDACCMNHDRCLHNEFNSKCAKNAAADKKAKCACSTQLKTCESTAYKPSDYSGIMSVEAAAASKIVPGPPMIHDCGHL